MVYDTYNWIIVKVEYEEDTFYKVIASVGGGLNDWRINSGITKVLDKGEYYEVFGCTGSSYICEKDSEKVDNTITNVLDRLKSHAVVVTITDVEDKYLLEPNEQE